VAENAVALADRALHRGAGLLRDAADPRAPQEDRIAALSVCESLTRQMEQIRIELVAGLVRDGAFAARGYRSPAQALADLLGCDTTIARRRVRVAEDVCPRTTLDGQLLPPRFPATAAEFTAGRIGLRQVERIADALRSAAAHRLAPELWGAAEAKLADQASAYRPSELAVFAHDLITVLDQDGPGERENDPPQPNELHLSIRTGKLKGQLDGLTREVLATALHALCLPRGPEDDRTAAQRRADALGEICQRVLDSAQLPRRGGERPHLNVIIPLEEWEQRARSAGLDFGAQLPPADLRMLACDARVVPVVLGGAGQPLDVGRARRTIPDGLRRAIAARDRGCAAHADGDARRESATRKAPCPDRLRARSDERNARARSRDLPHLQPRHQGAMTRAASGISPRGAARRPAYDAIASARTKASPNPSRLAERESSTVSNSKLTIVWLDKDMYSARTAS
jgi:hypothetical protein